MGNIYDELQPIMEYRLFFKLPDGVKQMGVYWHDKDGNPTKDPKRLAEKVPAMFHQSRQASTDEDFELIYQRELKKIDGAKDGKAFQKWIKKRVCEMRDFELTLKADVGKRSLEEQDLTDSFLDWMERKKTQNFIDPLTFIEPDILDFFIKAEKKALGEAGKFETDIRCAAFCELLYFRTYIMHTKTRQATMNEFSKGRYGINIKKALATTKKQDREKHKNYSVGGRIPLKNCF